MIEFWFGVVGGHARGLRHARRLRSRGGRAASLRRAHGRRAPAGACGHWAVLGRQRGLAARARRRAVRRVPARARLRALGLLLRDFPRALVADPARRSRSSSAAISRPTLARRVGHVFAVASVVLPVLFGAALGNLLRGVPLDSSGWFALSLFTDFSASRSRSGCSTGTRCSPACSRSWLSSRTARCSSRGRPTVPSRHARDWQRPGPTCSSRSSGRSSRGRRRPFIPICSRCSRRGRSRWPRRPSRWRDW